MGKSHGAGRRYSTVPASVLPTTIPLCLFGFSESGYHPREVTDTMRNLPPVLRGQPSLIDASLMLLEVSPALTREQDLDAQT